VCGTCQKKGNRLWKRGKRPGAKKAEKIEATRNADGTLVDSSRQLEVGDHYGNWQLKVNNRGERLGFGRRWP